MPSDTGAADRRAGRGATDAAPAGGGGRDESRAGRDESRAGRDESTAGRDESTAERDDRNLAALLLGPVAYHRLVFRQHQKERLVQAANAMAIGGLATVGLAVSAAVLLVTGYVDRGVPAILLTVVTVALFGGLWFVLPLAHRRQPDE